MSNRFDKWEQKIDTCKGTRQTFGIQLDWSKPEDVELIKVIATLKDNDKFSDAMRKALRIIPAMMFSGSLDELFEEFPWAKLEALQYLRELFADDVPPDDTPPSGNTPEPPEQGADNRLEEIEALRERVEAQQRWVEAEQERLEAERVWQERRLEEERQRIEQERQHSQNAVQEQLRRIEEILLQQGNIPIQSTADVVGQPVDEEGKPSAPHKPDNGVGLKGLKGQHVTMSAPMPEEDEDDEPLFEVKAHKGDGSANRRFIQALLALQEQPPEQ